jgi:hypothetical protein
MSLFFFVIVINIIFITALQILFMLKRWEDTLQKLVFFLAGSIIFFQCVICKFLFNIVIRIPTSFTAPKKNTILYKLMQTRVYVPERNSRKALFTEKCDNWP